MYTKIWYGRIYQSHNKCLEGEQEQWPFGGFMWLAGWGWNERFHRQLRSCIVWISWQGKGRSTWTFLSVLPDVGRRGRENSGACRLSGGRCQKESDSLLQFGYITVIRSEIWVAWFISYLHAIVGLLGRSAYLLSCVTCPFSAHPGSNWAAPGCCCYCNTPSNPRAKMIELKIYKELSLEHVWLWHWQL